MKNLNLGLISIAFLLLFLKVNCQSGPTYNEIAQILTPLPSHQLYYNGSYFFGDALMYNPTTGEITSYFPINGCTNVSYYTVTSNFKFYCLSISNITQIIQFNPFDGQILNTYYYTASVSQFFVQTNYIILYTIIDQNTTTFQVFDTSKSEFTCEYGPIYNLKVFNLVLLANFTLFVLEEDSALSYYSCGSGVPTYVSIGIVQIPLQWGSLNKTSIMYFYTPLLEGVNTILPFEVNSDGVVNVLNKVFVTLIGQYNDTHFITETTDGNGYKQFNVIVFEPNMQNYYTVASYNTSLNSPLIVAFLVHGETSILINIPGSYAFKWNFETNQIIAFYPSIPPILLSNGSSVYLAENGYFLQNSDGTFTAEYWHLSSIFYQSTSDLQIYYNLGLPFLTSSICYIAYINATSSQIVYQTIPNCPNNVKYPYYIKDLQYYNGELYIGYRDQSQQIFVLQASSGTLNAYQPLFFYVYCAVVLNPAAQTLIVGYTGVTYARIEAYSFDHHLLYNYIYRGGATNYISSVGGGIFVVAAPSFSSTKFTIYNGNTGATLQTFSIGQPVNLPDNEGNNQFLVLGVNPNNQAFIGGILTWTNLNAYIYNTNGNGGAIDIGLNILYQVNQINQTYFTIDLYSPIDNGTSVFIQSYYQVTDWSLSTIQAL